MTKNSFTQKIIFLILSLTQFNICKTTKKTSQQPLSDELVTIIDNIDTREGIVSIAIHLLNNLPQSI